MFISEKKVKGVKVLELIGRIDAQSGHFKDDLLQLVENDSKIIIDCNELNYINSSGLRDFLVVLKDTKEANSKLVVCNLQNNIKEIFKISGFLNLIELYDTFEDALNSFQ